MQYRSNSEQETIKIGYALGEKLEPNDIVALYGDLGAGKTAFVRGICSAFDAENVHSPTFNLVNEYEGRLKIYHFDAYRIDCDAWFDLGFDEYLYAGGVCVIEWANQVELPACIQVHIQGSGDMPREIKIEFGGGGYEHSCG